MRRLAIILSLLCPHLIASAQPTLTFTSLRIPVLDSLGTRIGVTDIEWGDYDGDADLDLLVVRPAGTILLRNEEGRFHVADTSFGQGFSHGEWCDFDGDDQLDILFNFKHVYWNLGSSFFEDQRSLDGITRAARCFDVDHDGDHDVAGSGEVYFNNGRRGFVSDAQVFIPYQAVRTAAADFDSDGDADLAITSFHPGTFLFENIGGRFREIERLNRISGSWSLAWGDVDSDGSPDLAVADWYRIHLYVNRSGDLQPTLIEPTKILGQLAWADFDGDGDQDLLGSGYEAGQILQNDGGVLGNPVPLGNFSAYAIGDYDRDGDLDLAVELPDSMWIFRNDGSAVNQPPTPPADLASIDVRANSARLVWSPASDDTTPPIALTYNVRLRPHVPSMTVVRSDTVFRTVVRPGNAFQDTTFFIRGLSPNTTYHWSVQAIDNGFASSQMAESETFKTLPLFSAVDSLLPPLGSGVAVPADIDSDGDFDFAMIGANSSGDIADLYVRDGDGYRISTAIPIDGGVSDAAWADFDNDRDLDLVVAGVREGPHPFSTILWNESGVFADDPRGISSLGPARISVGDYDRDGLVDIAMTGVSESGAAVARIFRNVGGAFVDVRASIAGVRDGDLAWVDFDVDGDLDLLVSGAEAVGNRFRLYLNDQSVFRQMTQFVVALRNGSLKWGDYDNDGDPDLAVSGRNQTEALRTRIYANDNGSLVQAAELKGRENVDLFWIDYDNDGNLDLSVAGDNVSTLYRNGELGFTRETIEFGSLLPSIGSWVDADSDGDTDHILFSNAVTTSFENNIFPSNTPPDPPKDPKVEALTIDGVILSWSAPRDDTTPSVALTYDIFVGTSEGAADAVSPAAIISGPLAGHRTLSQPGPLGSRTFVTVRGLKPLTEYFWGVQAVDHAFAGSAFVGGSFVTGDDLGSEGLEESRLEVDVFPNPVTHRATITVTMPFAADGSSVIISDVLGRRVGTVHRGWLTSGRNEFIWDASFVSSGVYVCVVEVGRNREIRKLVVVK